MREVNLRERVKRLRVSRRLTFATRRGFVRSRSGHAPRDPDVDPGRGIDIEGETAADAIYGYGRTFPGSLGPPLILEVGI